MRVCVRKCQIKLQHLPCKTAPQQDWLLECCKLCETVCWATLTCCDDVCLLLTWHSAAQRGHATRWALSTHEHTKKWKTETQIDASMCKRPQNFHIRNANLSDGSSPHIPDCQLASCEPSVQSCTERQPASSLLEMLWNSELVSEKHWGCLVLKRPGNHLHSLTHAKITSLAHSTSLVHTHTFPSSLVHAHTFLAVLWVFWGFGVSGFGGFGVGSWWHSLCLNTLDAAARTLLTCARFPHLFIHSLFLPPLLMRTPGSALVVVSIWTSLVPLFFFSMGKGLLSMGKQSIRKTCPCPATPCYKKPELLGWEPPPTPLRMIVEWASIYIIYDVSIISNQWHVVPVPNHLMDTESEFAPWDPSKAHIL